MSDGQAKTQTSLRRNKPFLSIRARLLVLALLAIAPLMVERVHGLGAARAARTKRANADVVDLARRGVEAQREIISSVRAILQIVSRVYAKVPIDGRIKCSTEPLAIGLNVSDRPHFQNALHSR